MFGTAAVIAAIGAGVAASIWSFNQGVDPEALKRALADMPPVKVETSGTVTMKDGTVTMREGTVSGTVALAPGATVSLAPGATVSIDGEIPVLPPPPPDAPTQTDDGDVIRTSVTVFKSVAHDGGDVVTGWVYPSGNAKAPDSQYCYYLIPGAEESRHIDLASNGVPFKIRDGLVSDLTGVLAKCQWWGS